ncbi:MULTISPECIES: tRNA (adenosine(37)-N6)-threonylcarbamoyltransferase complex dimerization subunit type 1 TsaB [Dermabacter]|uniref:tRNA (adenosine(37)-N6)-threonylcarbamoyltransferase complex dimerization subunit type 1 TsaB n=1 Tax=Dermabacter TaxID=36739 RepID=UPI000F86981D|nr:MULTISPECIES: tRNA (adenosine(37)-N6)-threonylcarbamoyltransferase complex dimerization subunit type 1 TsaB [Dermabacter]MCG7443495.1 tRNA (adenosine(37)-N6)-threonylcarbamoyltransferase complex dimerization subunit type 1 TsaB [Dermabacter vaginalis]RUP86169.1 tRNA (adenosine(37)-N6)-threonylcarbamoyltransferase complex dimerization subunit type 1 TsaB [Dermabacter sp. HSID17554]
MANLTLGIDTSGAVSVAVADACQVLSRRMDERARHHDEVLLEMIDAALAEAGASRADISCVVAGRGPGPFTGLRVGLVTARSIATILGARLIGLPSLDAIALEAAKESPDAKTIAVALDARRREVYWALYEVSGDVSDDSSREIVRTFEPGVAAPAEVASSLAAADVLVGSGAHLYPEILPPTGELRHADAGFLIQAALSAEARGEDLSSTEPLYLREADAAKPKRRKSTLGLGDRPA